MVASDTLMSMDGDEDRVAAGTAFRRYGPYSSPNDEAEIAGRVLSGRDLAGLALRACPCGAVPTGADGLHLHLESAVPGEFRDRG